MSEFNRPDTDWTKRLCWNPVKQRSYFMFEAESRFNGKLEVIPYNAHADDLEYTIRHIPEGQEVGMMYGRYPCPRGNHSG